jgi:hypothetical protein
MQVLLHTDVLVPEALLRSVGGSPVGFTAYDDSRAVPAIPHQAVDDTHERERVSCSSVSSGARIKQCSSATYVEKMSIQYDDLGGTSS